MNLGGRQNKDNMLRRFFEYFEQRVKGAGGKHVNLVDDIDAVLGNRRRENRLIPQITDIIHTVV
ncbi:hypothetical protein SDC9_156183 [bioreactor metagenome]|uniref:Uncharacterized protein n=1 Tax=bioreactor metagenome TaxID=1076179 RepID=A0A645F3H7_9ZZZZ